MKEDITIKVAEDEAIRGDGQAAATNYGSLASRYVFTTCVRVKYNSLLIRSPMIARPLPSPAPSNRTISSLDAEPIGRPIYEKPADVFEIARLRSRLSAVASLTMVVFGVSFIG